MSGFLLNSDSQSDRIRSVHLRYKEDSYQISKMGEEGIFSPPFPFLPSLFAKWAWDAINHISSSLFDLLGTWRQMERTAIQE